MPWRHQFSMMASDDSTPGLVEVVERARRQRPVELRTVRGQLRLQTVEHALGQAFRVGVGLHHQRRHRADEHGLGDPAFAVAAEVADHLAATGGVPDVNGVAQVQMLGQRGEVVGVVVEVVAVGRLGGPAVTAPVVRDHPIAMLQEEQHLRVPVVGGQRPAVAEHDRLTRSPVLVEDVGAVGGGVDAHGTRFLDSTPSVISTGRHWPVGAGHIAARHHAGIAFRAGLTRVFPRGRPFRRRVSARGRAYSASGIKPLTCRFKPSEPPRTTKKVRTARLAPRLRPDTGKSTIMKTSPSPHRRRRTVCRRPRTGRPRRRRPLRHRRRPADHRPTRRPGQPGHRQPAEQQPAERRQRRRHPPGIPDPGIHLGPAARRPHPRNRRPRHLRRRQVTPTPQRGAPHGAPLLACSGRPVGRVFFVEIR